MHAAKLIWAIRLSALTVLATLALAWATGAKAEAGPFEYARSSERSVFSGGQIAFQFRLNGAKPRNLDIEVVRKGAGIVTTIPARGLPPRTHLAVDWTGTNLNSKPSKPGGYLFRARNPKSKKLVSMKRVRGKRSFKVKKAPSSVFPVRGSYDFGGSGARFGAGRAGHSHQGQDVMAACGTPLVSPEAGQVVARAFQSSAGHYVVVRLAASGHEAAFMHLERASWAKVGTKVFPGQQIGRVGATGNAQGCHLHFELWAPPGWYKGGAPYDPLPTLQNWA